MAYGLLGQDLHVAADKARRWFAHRYGATGFKCEAPVKLDLPLRPTWQANLRTGYLLCVNVQSTPFSPTLHEFVNGCAQQRLPIKLWVAIGEGGPKDSFGADLKQARNLGVGVVHIYDNGDPHEYHRPVPLSLFALARTEFRRVPAPVRETIKNAEDTFLDGHPGEGCQSICQELENISRSFAHETYKRGWWKSPPGANAPPARFFTRDSWAGMLKDFDDRANVAQISKKCPSFTKQLIAGTRAYTDWRNSVSHKPKTVAQRKVRDARLRTMFEATRDLVLDWFQAAKPLGLLK